MLRGRLGGWEKAGGRLWGRCSQVGLELGRRLRKKLMGRCSGGGKLGGWEKAQQGGSGGGWEGEAYRETLARSCGGGWVRFWGRQARL